MDHESDTFERTVELQRKTLIRVFIYKGDGYKGFWVYEALNAMFSSLWYVKPSSITKNAPSWQKL